jgi:hypothetical protein
MVINLERLCAVYESRVDVIWLSHLDMLRIPCFSPLSIGECHNILPYKRASTPLTEPDAGYTDEHVES